MRLWRIGSASVFQTDDESSILSRRSSPEGLPGLLKTAPTWERRLIGRPRAFQARRCGIIPRRSFCMVADVLRTNVDDGRGSRHQGAATPAPVRGAFGSAPVSKTGGSWFEASLIGHGSSVDSSLEEWAGLDRSVRGFESLRRAP